MLNHLALDSRAHVHVGCALQSRRNKSGGIVFEFIPGLEGTSGMFTFRGDDRSDRDFLIILADAVADLKRRNPGKKFQFISHQRLHVFSVLAIMED